MMKHRKPVRVRFAPSPTGHTHLGSGRTALYDYLLARQSGGQFILRIEDTDQKRYVPGAERELIDSLHWLGLDWDEGPDVGGPCAPYRQSERREIYQEHAHWLVEAGHAYYCFCTPEQLDRVRKEQQARKETAHYVGTCRRLDPDEAAARVRRGEPYVIRFKVPEEGSVTGRDLLRGDITVANRQLGDYVIFKSDGLALYHLAAMVDDHLMGITHVIRGSEWLPTFPLHVHIVRAFGWEEPEWVHLSVFLKPSGKGKMSKRETAQVLNDGYSIFIKDLQDLGYMPEGVLNWIALMGWSYDDHTEFFALPDLVEKFSLEKLNPSPAAINFTKLDHFNGLHIRALGLGELARRLEPYFHKAGYYPDPDLMRRIVPVIRERMVTLDEGPEVAAVFFDEDIHPDTAELIGKNINSIQARDILKCALRILENLPEFTHTAMEGPLRQLVEQTGLGAGQVFGVLRVATMGRKVSPPLFESMAIIGREKVLNRLRQAISMLE